MKTIVLSIAALLATSLTACSQEPSLGETRNVTAADIGFVPPAPRASKLPIGEIRPNTPVATLVQELEKAKFQVSQTVNSRKLSGVNENNVLNTLVSDVTETQLSADQMRSNNHPGDGIQPDMNIFHTSATIYNDRHLASASFKIQWSDKHKLGLPEKTVNNLLTEQFGTFTMKERGSDSVDYYFDRNGIRQDTASVDGSTVTIAKQWCSDPRAGITSSGNPKYDSLICSLQISYFDKNIKDAFDKQVPSLLNSKLVELFGPLKPKD